ncbi:MAG: hypothetical protein A3I75_03460 [Deltaproteobacteria bacterium RIFCSPLOWO2_02_FULL_50_16]|nr:MAG: hypothetical protein A3I75_03460 [Deltaproteobacteria bacterium RIFCSPLOWO2_02_FULL_50_16]
MCIKKTYIHNILILAVGLLLTVTLASCKKIKGDAGTPTDTAGEVDPSGGDLTQGDFQLTSLEPSSGKSGDRFVLTGEVLDAATDLVMFGEIPVIPHAVGDGARQFFFASTSVQTAKTDEAKGQISAFVPQGVCDQEYVVIVVRSDKRSTGKKFTVVGEKPCPGSADETEDADETEETGTPEPTTVGETVVGGEGEGDLQPAEFVLVEATLGLSREIVYRQLNPTTTLSWSVSHGVVDAVTIYANGNVLSHGGVIYHNHLNVSGSVDLEPLERTHYQAVFTSRGEVVAVKEAEVSVIGEENDLSLIPYFDVAVSPLSRTRTQGNNFIAEPITVRFVANQITGIDFTFSEQCVTPPCPSLGRRHYASLNGSFTFRPEVTAVFRAVATTDERETIEITRNIQVTLAAVGAEYTATEWEDRSDQSYLPGYARYRVRVRNAATALIQSQGDFSPCLWAAGSCVPLSVVNIGGGNKIHVIPLASLPAGSGDWKIYEFYWRQNCGTGASTRCRSTLKARGYNDVLIERDKEVMSLTPTPTLSAELKSGDWRQMHVEWSCLNCRDVIVTSPCSPRTFTGFTGNTGSQDIPICSKNQNDNRATLSYKDPFSPTVHTLSAHPSNGPSTTQANITNSDIGNRNNGRDGDGRYRIPWRTLWAVRAEVQGYTPEGTTCGRLRSLSLNFSLGDGSSEVTGANADFPVDPDCYVFEVTAYDVEGGPHRSGRITAQSKIVIQYIDNGYGWQTCQHDCSPNWWCGDQDRCSATGYTRYKTVVVKNASNRRPRVMSAGNGYTCPMDDDSGDHIWMVINELESSTPRERQWGLEHRYYYNSSIAYGCKVCIDGEPGGGEICTSPSVDWSNQSPYYEGSSWCHGETTTGAPEYSCGGWSLAGPDSWTAVGVAVGVVVVGGVML